MRVLYLVRSPANTNRTEFRNRILDFAGQNLVNLADSLVVAVSDLKTPVLSVIPFRKDLIALISMDGVKEECRWPIPPEGFAGAYVSEVAFPVIHELTWNKGERSPGVGLFTVFRKKPGLDESEFLHRWYNGHTPLTLDVHPNAGYVRNRVVGVCSEAGTVGDWWDGIVEEQYDPPEDLLKPGRFFGGRVLGMLPVMIQVYRDVCGFIDYSSIQTWLTSEYRIK